MRSAMAGPARKKVNLVVQQILSDQDDAALGVTFVAKNVFTNAVVKCALAAGLGSGGLHANYTNWCMIQDALGSQTVLSMYAQNMHNDTMLLASDYIGSSSQHPRACVRSLKRKRPQFSGEDEESWSK